MNPIEEVYNHWNSKEGVWKSHRKLNPLMADAIQRRLEDVGLEDIKIAIDNYHDLLNDDSYKWTYKWTLREFLTRHRDRSKDDQDLQILRFTEDEFEKKNYPRIWEAGIEEKFGC